MYPKVAVRPEGVEALEQRPTALLMRPEKEGVCVWWLDHVSSHEKGRYLFGRNLGKQIWVSRQQSKAVPSGMRTRRPVVFTRGADRRWWLPLRAPQGAPSCVCVDHELCSTSTHLFSVGNETRHSEICSVGTSLAVTISPIWWKILQRCRQSDDGKQIVGLIYISPCNYEGSIGD